MSENSVMNQFVHIFHLPSSREVFLYDYEYKFVIPTELNSGASSFCPVYLSVTL